MSTVPPPLSVLLELTHRCPLACPYCSNPIALAALREEMDTAGWRSLLEQAAEMGVLQAHFSGGEPMLRKDLPELVAHARALGLYSNLITSGVAGGEPMLDQLQAAGLEHVQLSVQDVDPAGADHIAGYRNSLSKKRAFAAAVRARGLPLTLNAVIHRHNAERVPGMIALALEWGAERIEVAHTQYYGWGLRNRAALMPSREQLAATIVAVETARRSLGDQLAIDFVTPITTRASPSPAWAAGRSASSISLRVATCCRAMRPKPSTACSSTTCAIARWPISGITARPSRVSAAPRGCPRSARLPEAGDRLGRLPLPGTGPGRRCRHPGPGLRTLPGPCRDPRHRRTRGRIAGTGFRLSPAGASCRRCRRGRNQRHRMSRWRHAAERLH